MFSAEIVTISKLPNGRVNIVVKYSDGAVTLPNETIIPQDKNGFDYAIIARLAELNFDVAATPTGPYTPPKPTQPQPPTPAQQWFKNVNRYWRIKTYLIDTGIKTGNETEIVAIKSSIVADYDASFLTDI